jgi:hypothetical protein
MQSQGIVDEIAQRTAIRKNAARQRIMTPRRYRSEPCVPASKPPKND